MMMRYWQNRTGEVLFSIKGTEIDMYFENFSVTANNKLGEVVFQKQFRLLREKEIDCNMLSSQERMEKWGRE